MIKLLPHPVVLTQDVDDDLSVLFWLPNDISCDKARVESMRDLLSWYFRLDVDLGALYSEWHRRDSKVFPFTSMEAAALSGPWGVRLLRQNAFESLLSFICSQNNMVSRISKMVLSLKSGYGDQHWRVRIGRFCDEDDAVVDVYSFPNADKLAPAITAQQLRDMGFGYRAEYIQSAAEKVATKSVNLMTMKCPSDASPSSSSSNTELEERYLNVWNQLQDVFDGVGPKVADCVALTGLHWACAVPVDVHIRRLASQHGVAAAASSGTLTRKKYADISGQFRAMFGALAGWAHLVLFAVELRKGKRNAVDSAVRAIKRSKGLT